MEPDRRFSILVYLEESRQPFVSLVFILPILASYEIGVRLVNVGRKLPTINGADAILKHTFQAFGFYGSLISALCIILTLVLLQLHKHLPWRVRSATLIVMIFESIVVALPLFGLDKLVNAVLLAAGPSGTSVPETLILSLGAGVYEEYLFRMLLLGGLLGLGRTLFRRRDTLTQALCVIVSAVLFSIFHHLGPYGDSFDLRIFAFRTIAGVYFAWIYLARGFGISVGCHTCYNLLVVGLGLMQ
jgi:hypothetical protein